MLCAAYHNATGVQKASGFYLEGLQALCWVIEGVRELGLTLQVVHHIDDAYRNYMDATIEIDLVIRAIGNELVKDSEQHDKVISSLDVQQVYTNQILSMLKDDESTFHIPSLPDRNIPRVPDTSNSTTRNLTMQNLDEAELLHTELACAEHASAVLARELCALEARIAQRTKVKRELELIRDEFSKCMMHIGDKQEMVQELAKLIFSLCGLAAHFDNLLGNTENGIVAQQMKGLMIFTQSHL